MNLRLFCRYVCPLGLSQSLVRGFRGPRRVCTRLPESALQRVVRWTVFFLYVASFFVGALYMVKPFVDPFSIICRAVAYTFFSPETDAALAALAYVPLAAVLLVSLFSKGRFWCNWICPWGTALNEASRYLCSCGRKGAVARGDRVGKGCGKCRRCFAEAQGEEVKAEG